MISDNGSAAFAYVGSGLCLFFGPLVAISGLIAAACGHPRGLICAGIGAAIAAVGAKAWGLW